MPQNKTYLANIDKSKLDKLKRVKLAEAKKIELALVDEAETSIKLADKEIEILKSYISIFEDIKTQYLQATSRISDFVQESSNDRDVSNSLADLMNDQQREFDKSAEALGIDVSKIPLATDLEDKSTELANLVGDLEDVIEEADRLI
jgi:hypothetical protein|tara:strand:+ start:16441 stop:16881 length:441 start_codon:yes stop_codon:yes gene_type:complete